MRVYATAATTTGSGNRTTSSAPHATSAVAQHDMDVIARHFQFLRDDDADAERGDSDWEVRMSVRYYQKLFREYALADLSRFREGKIGLRWRTESEVVSGKGQFVCGNKRCDARTELHSYELLFAYVEHGEKKRCLVKVRVCEECAGKIFFKKLERMRRKELKKEVKKRKQELKDEHKGKGRKRKRSDASSDEETEPDGANSEDRLGIHALCAEINAEETKEETSERATSSGCYFEDRKGGNNNNAFKELLL